MREVNAQLRQFSHEGYRRISTDFLVKVNEVPLEDHAGVPCQVDCHVAARLQSDIDAGFRVLFYHRDVDNCTALGALFVVNTGVLLF